jgi:hypothetical protein
MSEVGDLAAEYLRAVLPGPDENRELFDMLKAAIADSEVAVRVTCGDGTEALMAFAQSGDATLYRVSEPLEVEVFSFGRLANGVLSETLKIAEKWPEHTHTSTVKYANASLDPVGGSVSMTGPADAERIRSTLLPFVGSPDT